MKKKLLLWGLFALLLPLVWSAGISAGETEEWIVAFDAAAPANEIEETAADYGLRHVIDGYYRTTAETAAALKDSALVAEVFPSGKAELCENVTYTPVYNDTESKDQWGLRAVNIENCWRYYTRGSKDVVVCVIDSGFFYEHPDAGRNFVAGKDYVDGGVNDHDDTSHGTSCAGVIGATTNNNEGITGLCADVTVVSQRAFYWDEGSKTKIATTGVIAEAIKDAVDEYHADVISMSFLFSKDDLEKDGNVDLLEAACRYADENGAILVAAAGNNHQSLSGRDDYCYPAYYDCVIGVGAVDSKFQPASFSARNRAVFCCAPGVSVLTLGNPASKEDEHTPLYRSVGGTSLATPFVAGLAVMARSVDKEYSSGDFMILLSETCVDLGGKGYDTTYGYGLVDYENAMKTLFNKKDGNVFTDVSKQNWFYGAVVDVYNKKLMVGVKETEFAPAMKLTRAMFVTILYRLAGEPEVKGSAPFTDVAKGSWYEPAVIWGEKNKIAQGLGNGVFAPDKDISRQELVTMLYRYYHDYEKKALAAESKSVSFKDSGDIAGWAAAAVKVMTDAGVLRGYDNGDGTHSFRPQNTATRAEAAQIISGLSKLTP
ncbi:MAG: S8 family peptidase [Bacillota bacterium]|jgi:subtilisin family serine protease